MLDTNTFLDNGMFDSDWFLSLTYDEQEAHKLHYWNHVGALFKRPPFPTARIKALGDDGEVEWSRVDTVAALRVHAQHAKCFREYNNNPGDAFKSVEELVVDIKKHAARE